MVIFITRSLKRKIRIAPLPCSKTWLAIRTLGVLCMRAPPVKDGGTHITTISHTLFRNGGYVILFILL
jgi:hypothetical protein